MSGHPSMSEWFSNPYFLSFMENLSQKQLKKDVKEILKNADFKERIKAICSISPKKIVNALFPFLYDTDELIKWRSITSIGIGVSAISDICFESARVIMRRLMWNLNDESGGIGWGSPEAMGEIMANNKAIAKEYSKILISYISNNGNFLENEWLQKGVIWGLSRISETFPEFIIDSSNIISPFLDEDDIFFRGCSAFILSLIHYWPSGNIPTKLLNDKSELKFYKNGDFIETTIADLAKGLQ
ncbi:MAG: hypothetical protein HQK76_04220 [Desulfobacterales bacterium]|nr:hypothetical protein [Desulfobacterales bacterium]